LSKKSGNAAAVCAALAKPIADELGLVLWDVVYEKEGSQWYLRVYIEREAKDIDNREITIDDCVAMTRPLDKALDEADPTDDAYVLEVSSPGLERRLVKPAHFESYIGKLVKARYVREQNGVRDIKGTLVSFDKENVILDTETGEIAVKRSLTAFIKADDAEIFSDI
jgi:ribosome maturation factor RimP